VTQDLDKPSADERGRSARGGRDRLLGCAESVFGAGGPEAPLEDVALAAGVSKSLVFRYWPSKAALLDEVMLRAGERYRGWIEHACWSRPDAPVRAVAGAAVGFFAQPVHALFDPLAARPADDNVPDLYALDGIIAARVDEITTPEYRAPARAVVDAVVLGTVRGWIGTPALSQLALTSEQLTDAIVVMVEEGLGALRAVPVPGRRPRRDAAPLSRGISTRSPLEAAFLDAALEVFSRAGYDDARLEDIAAHAGSTASALFTYWPGKQELFLQLRIAIVSQIATRLLDAMSRYEQVTDRLQAAIRSNLETHYLHPEYQPVLLPVASLPRAAELETVGWQLTIEQLHLIPQLDDAGDLLPVATAIGLAVLRGVTLTMHRQRVHPEVAIGIAQQYLGGAIDGVARQAGVSLDRATPTQ
jgi:AcrR family transcriptional regulator